MIEDTPMAEALDARARRRDFFRTAAGAAAVTAGAAALLSAGSSGNAQSTGDDANVLNFALNLEYLEAQFYSYAAFGEGLPNSLLGSGATRGEAVGGRKVNFTDRVIEQYAREIAQDERNHVEFLRTTIGNSAIAQPRINIGGGANGAFTQAARAAGLIGPDERFDPYASDENFLLAAYIFEDVGVTAYKGAIGLLGSRTLVQATGGLLAVEAYHAGLIRTSLFRKGLRQPELRQATVAISNARDSLDGPEDRDQGVYQRQGVANVAPLDEDGLVFTRSPGEVLNIVYLNDEAVVRGGFFPNGVNGNIKKSDANQPAE